MTELNENKTNEQNINEKEPKKKRSKITILLVLILVGVVVYAGYSIAKPYIQQYIGKQGNAALESLKIGETYTYSEEQKEEFRQKATELMEKQVAEKDLKPGESYYYKEFWDEWKEAVADENGYIEQEIGQLSDRLRRAESFSNIGYSGYKYDADKLEAGNLFNEDLSLKEPDLFYGYTSVGSHSDEVNQLQELYSEYKDRMTINDEIYATKCIDEAFKNSTDAELYEYLNNLYKENPDLIYTSARNYFSKDVLENLEDYLIGSEYYYVRNWLSEDSQNSANALLSFIKSGAGVGSNHYEIVDQYGPVSKIVGDVYADPLDYNYYIDNHDYFVTYVPSSVSKLSDKTYIVDIEVDKPIDELGASIIRSNFLTAIKNNDNDTSNLKDIDLRVLVRIKYSKAPNLSEFFNLGVFDIINNSDYLVNADGKTVYSFFSNGYPWYPSEEALVWAEDFYTLAKEAYDNDTYFSIFETISDLSKKYGISENDMTSVIFSCR